ncbi:MAG: glycosyltransferase family 4 protein [Candidatus Solibacter usitatus]|nr:glycosyltransferase family 4 protein [Candidatus Solibacter usitatus]
MAAASTLRIGVNALYLIPGAVGGTEIYLRCLLQALAAIDRDNHYVVFTNRETGSGLAPDHANFTVEQQPVHARSRPARILWEQTGLPLRVAARGLDVLWNPGFTAPLLCGCPQVTVFHDMQHKRHPEHFRWFDLPFWRLLLYWSAHLSTRLIAVSSATRDDLLRYYRLPATVVWSGVDSRFFGIRHAAQYYFLAVSTLHPHKNLDGLLRAFAQFRKTHPEFRLIVAGLRGFQTAELEQLRLSLDLAEAVEFTGWVTREMLYRLYAGAFAFLYPTTFEGFGLPLLEALAAGLPAACSRIEPLTTLADDAALFIEPGSDAAILESMTALATDADLRGRLAAAGPPRAAQFSWEASARATLQVLGQAARQTI